MATLTQRIVVSSQCVVTVLDEPDKSDPLNQVKVVLIKWPKGTKKKRAALSVSK